VTGGVSGPRSAPCHHTTVPFYSDVPTSHITSLAAALNCHKRQKGLEQFLWSDVLSVAANANWFT